MRFEPSRLRSAEWVIGTASAAMLVDAFLLPWYEVGFRVGEVYVSYARTSLNAWDSLTVLRFLVPLTALGGLAVWFAQAARESPALPVVLTTIGMIPSALLVLTLIWRVLIDNPGIHRVPSSFVEAKLGAYIGLILSVAIFLSIYRSLREDGVSSDIGSRRVEMLSLEPQSGGSQP